MKGIKPDWKTEIKKVEEAIATNNSDAIKSASESLTKAWSEIAQKLYQQTGPTDQAPPQPGEGATEPPQGEAGEKEKENEVQDASYEVVDDDENETKKDK